MGSKEEATGRESQILGVRGTVGKQISNLGCWDGDRQRPGGKMTLCGRWI